MAKRGTTEKRNGIVVAQEIRALILANKSIKGPEVMAALREKYPKETFNDKSCQVTYANIRKSLGLTRTLMKKPLGSKAMPGRPGAGWRQIGNGAASGDSSVDISLLQSAKELLQQCDGDVTIAVQALNQIAALQMN